MSWENVENLPDPGPLPGERADREEPNAVRDGQRDLLEALFTILDVSNRGKRSGLAWRLNSSFRRYVALLWLVRPGMLGNATQEEVAKALGMSKSGFNAVVVKLSDRFPSLRNILMHSPKWRSREKGAAADRRSRAITWFLDTYAVDHVIEERGEWIVKDRDTGAELGRGTSRWRAICKAAGA